MSQRIDRFLELYTSHYTKKTYKYILKSFFQTIYPDNPELAKRSTSIDALNTVADHYFAEFRDHESDIQTVQHALNGRAPKSIHTFLACIKSFLIENKVELSQRFWRRTIGRVKGNRARTQDKVPHAEDLRKILAHLPIQGRALYLLLASSGMRIGEGVSLQLNDVNVQDEPMTVNIRGEYTKTGNRRVAFASSEAKAAIQEWLKVRNQYLTHAIRRSMRVRNGKKVSLKSMDDPRLFPFTVSNARTAWNKALKKSRNGAKDLSTGIRLLHPHVLRKFFRTNLATVIPRDVVEALMGHESYLTEVYRRYSIEQLKEFYLRGEYVLLVLCNGHDVKKLRTEVEEKSQQLQTVINGLAAENITLKERMNTLMSEKETLQGQVQEQQTRVQQFELVAQRSNRLIDQMTQLQRENKTQQEQLDVMKQRLTSLEAAFEKAWRR